MQRNEKNIHEFLKAQNFQTMVPERGERARSRRRTTTRPDRRTRRCSCARCARSPVRDSRPTRSTSRGRDTRRRSRSPRAISSRLCPEARYRFQTNYNSEWRRLSSRLLKRNVTTMISDPPLNARGILLQNNCFISLPKVVKSLIRTREGQIFPWKSLLPNDSFVFCSLKSKF